MRNTGVELSLNYVAVNTKDWYWTMNYNLTYNRNRITDLNGVSDTGDPVTTGDNIDNVNKVLAYQTGYAANSFYVYEQMYDKNGKPIEGAVVGRNNDGVISEADKYLYKQVAAPVTMGFSTRVEWKNFDLGFSLRANLGNYVFNNFEQGKRLKTTSSVWCQNAYLANRPVNTLGWDSDALESTLSTVSSRAALGRASRDVCTLLAATCSPLPTTRVSILRCTTVLTTTSTRVLSHSSSD